MKCFNETLLNFRMDETVYSWNWNSERRGHKVNLNVLNET